MRNNRSRQLTWLAPVVAMTLMGAPAATSTRTTTPPPGDGATEETAAPSRLDAGYGALPLAFEQNHGQHDARIDFLARGREYALWLTPSAAFFTLGDPGDRAADRRVQAGSVAAPVSLTTIRMAVVGGNPRAQGRGEARLPGIVNHLTGRNPSDWHVGVPTFGAVRYASVYPGIDLVYYGNQRSLEYDFVVAPGADPARIRLRFDGADALRVADDGRLVVRIAGRDMTWRAPVLYQDIRETRVPVVGRFRLVPATAATAGALPDVAFTVGAYDPSVTLVIDPVLEYSSYLGGSGNDDGLDIAVNAAGEAFVIGSTTSPTFAGGVAVGVLGGVDAFVTRIDAAGTTVVYTTFFGGSGADVGRGIALDANDHAFVTGNTSSTDFPVVAGSFDTVANGADDAFVAELDSAGAFVYAGYLGGYNIDVGEDIALDSQGRALVTGHTASANFPLSVLALNGAVDAFVARIDAAGAVIDWTTLLGGTGSDYGFGIVASGNQSYVTGMATDGFPTTVGAFQTVFGGGAADAFVARIGGGGAILSSTYVGGTSDEGGNAIALGPLGHAFITGFTTSVDYPLTNPIQAALAGATDAFVTKLNGTLASQTYSTYLGGALNDSGHAIVVSSSSVASVTGETFSTDFPLVDEIYSTMTGTYDAFLTKVGAAGTSWRTSGYLGGLAGRGIAHSSVVPGIYLTGTAGSVFPIVGGVQTVFGGGTTDAFVMKVVN